MVAGSGKAVAALTFVDRKLLPQLLLLAVQLEGVQACTVQVVAYEKGVMHETPSVARPESASPFGMSWLRKAPMGVPVHPLPQRTSGRVLTWAMRSGL